MSFLAYDDRAMRVSDADRAELGLMAAHLHMESGRVAGEQGFFDAPFDVSTAAFVSKRAQALKRKGFKRLIVCGIGGSDLGARALIGALAQPGKGMAVDFLSSPDPDVFARVLPSKNDWKKTALYVVSKSGTTLETLATFLALRAALIRAVGAKDHAAHVVVTTEPKEDNPLLALARDEGYEVLAHPLNVGGRFSVLTVVGLFPAACAGIDVRGILLGAQRLEEDRRVKREACMAARFAANHLLAYRAGRKIHVLMPYAENLRELGRWYRQLWAESLGKDGQGPTPVAAVGPVDQHSQMQLYHDGPDDKAVTFIEVDKFAVPAKIPFVKGREEFFKLSGLAFADILHAERAGTAHALTQIERPNGTFTIPSISPESMGSLLQCLMQATVFVGELMGINPFDQPGVEDGKKATRRALGL